MILSWWQSNDIMAKMPLTKSGNILERISWPCSSITILLRTRKDINTTCNMNKLKPLLCCTEKNRPSLKLATIAVLLRIQDLSCYILYPNRSDKFFYNQTHDIYSHGGKLNWSQGFFLIWCLCTYMIPIHKMIWTWVSWSDIVFLIEIREKR